MRHFTWAVAWFIVGLTVTLGTASVLQQVVTTRQAAATSTIAPAPSPSVKPPALKSPAEGHDVLVASRRPNRFR
jgi:hypothetical protein